MVRVVAKRLESEQLAALSEPPSLSASPATVKAHPFSSFFPLIKFDKLIVCPPKISVQRLALNEL